MKTDNFNKDYLVNDFLRKICNIEQETDSSPKYPAWNLLYYVFLCVFKPTKENIIIETGTHKGLSTIIMAQVFKDFNYKGKIYTIEISKPHCDKTQENIKEAQLDKYIEVINGNSLIELEKLLPKITRIDFAFLDGSHSCPDVYAEFNLIKDMVQKSEGSVYFDNVMWGGVKEALDKIKLDYPSGNLILFPNCSYTPDGQAIWQFAKN